jgi:electron transfer flavoprotein alpha subunit
MNVVLVEHAGGEVDEVSLQTMALARGLGDVAAVAIGPGAEGVAAAVGAHGAASLHVADLAAVSGYAPRAWAQAVWQLAQRLSAGAVLAPGSERGNEVMAHVAALADLPLAANCVSVTAGDPLTVTRVRWGGSLLEEAAVHSPVALLTAMPHSVEAQETDGGAAAVESFTPELSAADVAVQVAERVTADSGGVSLAEAKVVISGGRGVGSSEGFAVIEELASLLDGAVGCSRAVTSAGWRPHTDQVGQTGTKIAPEIYIPCGISGATQHMAGCKGAKRILAINTDREASIVSNADYAVIGDLHEVLPAISAEVRKARG